MDSCTTDRYERVNSKLPIQLCIDCSKDSNHLLPVQCFASAIMAINWSEEAFSISYLAEQREFPQLIKIARTSNRYQHGSPSTTANFSHGDVFKLHGLRIFKKVVITGAAPPSSDSELVANDYGYLSPPGNTSIYRQYSVPVSFSTPLQILPFRDLKHVYRTAGDLVAEKSRPSSVIVNQQIYLPEKNCVIKKGDILAISSVDKRCTSSGVVDFLICKHNDKTIGLPMSCVGDFTAHCEETIYSLSNLLATHIDFPQKAKFLNRASSQGREETLARDGQHHIVRETEYILENVVKQQYLICTKCAENEDLQTTKLYFVPSNSRAAQHLRVHLPLFHDLKTYRQIMSSGYCANLSMKNVIDCTPIEPIGDSHVVIRNLSDVYDITAPELPPRKEIMCQGQFIVYPNFRMPACLMSQTIGEIFVRVSTSTIRKMLGKFVYRNFVPGSFLRNVFSPLI